MARVIGPLFSQEASGTYGGTLTFAKWKGRAYVRQRVIPENPKSAQQVGNRAMMSFLVKAWAAVKLVSDSTWTTLATQRAISTFNAFVGTNMDRWQNFKAPSHTHPAAEAQSAITVTTQTLTGGVGHITVAVTPSSATNIWGIMIFRDAAEIASPSWANCIAVIFTDDANPVTFVDSPLVAGTYHYRTAVFTTDGTLGTVKADASATAT